ncbi:response regulator [Pseudoduganella albidiflava]|uniref:Response regulator n=1 Tax=Pseudoduganella albidiflava TaxID=321983 RepID=A0A411WWM2_9BURK|nr:response regulator [Pseudoduganella albidiflava]QBI01193.1 response regulator [Pseudoduganella albidiflava]GGY48847.1 hypothetical protein GCM10007387_33890 [Pseudoduganella albidiflava]
MNQKILLVEDNPYKQSRILDFLNSLDGSIQITTAASFTSACQRVLEQDFTLIVLDVSLPTYDRSASDSGGKFRILAGREIARKLTRAKSKTKIVFLTQYSSFSDKGNSYTFDSLAKQLRLDCGDSFVGMVFFDATSALWKEALESIVKEIKYENNNL